jgi:hypothetical protein
MLKVKLFFTRTRGADDIVQIYDDESYVDMARIVYTPGDHTKKSNVFHMTTKDVLSYVENILDSMEHDTDPFEFMQIQTAIHPSVMFSAMDLSRARVQGLLDNMIFQALRVNVEEMKLKRTVRTPVEGC